MPSHSLRPCSSACCSRSSLRNERSRTHDTAEAPLRPPLGHLAGQSGQHEGSCRCRVPFGHQQPARSEEHTSELQSLMRISYAVFCLNKTKNLLTKKDDLLNL